MAVTDIDYLCHYFMLVSKMQTANNQNLVSVLIKYVDIKKIGFSKDNKLNKVTKRKG